MPTEASQSAVRRILPQPAALCVTDDAGSTHRHDPPPVWFPWIIREREPTSRAIRRQQMTLGWDQQMGMVMGLLIGAIIVTSRVAGLPDYVTLAAAFAVGSLSAWIMWGQIHRHIEASWDSLGRQWTDAGLTRGRCPLCLYSLTGAATEHELTRCPECGAIWQASRVGTVTREPPPRWRQVIHTALGITATRPMHDDLGRSFSAEKLRMLMSASSDPPVRAALGRVRAVGASLRIGLATAAGAFYVFPLIALAKLAARSSPGFALKPAFALLVLLIGTAGVIAFIWCSELGLSAEARRRRMLQAGLCPVCASPDRAAHELHPGYLRCSGCSATWRG